MVNTRTTHDDKSTTFIVLHKTDTGDGGSKHTGFMEQPAATLGWDEKLNIASKKGVAQVGVINADKISAMSDL
jgi:hypothetical protein